MGFPRTDWSGLEAAGSGDGAAWERFYYDYLRPVMFMMKQLVPSFSDETVERLAHETLVKFFSDGILARALEYRRQHPGERFGKFLYTRLVYGVRNELAERARHGGTELPPAESLAATDEAADTFTVQWACNTIMVPAIRDLKEEYLRQGKLDEYHLFLERYYYGRKPEEISRTMRSAHSPKRVSELTIRAKARLRELIEERLARASRQEQEDVAILRDEFAQALKKVDLEGLDPLIRTGYEMLFTEERIHRTTGTPSKA